MAYISLSQNYKINDPTQCTRTLPGRTRTLRAHASSCICDYDCTYDSRFIYRRWLIDWLIDWSYGRLIDDSIRWLIPDSFIHSNSEQTSFESWSFKSHIVCERYVPDRQNAAKAETTNDTYIKEHWILSIKAVLRPFSYQLRKRRL